ncbi:FAD-dependent oxidoreductase [Nocardia bovistercoris]|uniref:FAD-dependent monooxygenase n=1 Tax=Nocardia bovistercoris TaxID=2785916 RepID=A0A931N2I0_9NOCA|nr:NAD(P)/FAD-dependent oxidoreductase [Nocardia bovistercoris]MBH0776752.1 FAD-dependent monooxygenase [Nocardia bovistercoris]
MWKSNGPRNSSAPTSSGLRVLIVGAGVGGISAARGLLRDGHDVTVFERAAAVRAKGGAVTIWPNGAKVLGQLGVDMDGAGQVLSEVRVSTATGRRVAEIDLAALSATLGKPTRMVPRRILLERLMDGFPRERVRCDARVVGVRNTSDGVRVDFADGASAEGDLLIGADGRHSTVRAAARIPEATHTGWCSWQGLIELPDLADSDIAVIIIGEGGNLGLWPAGAGRLQWWFDLPWSPDFVRPDSPVDTLRAHFTGWSPGVDRVLAKLTDDDLRMSPFPHFRHPIPRAWGHGRLTLLGDAAHTMPPTLAQGTNQALLDTMVLRRSLASAHSVPDALRRYEKIRRRKVAAVSWVTARQVSHGEATLKPAALLPSGLTTRALTDFIRATSHPKLSAETSEERTPIDTP